MTQEATPKRRVFTRFIRLKNGRVLDARAYGKQVWSFLVSDTAANSDTEPPEAQPNAVNDDEERS